MWTTIQAIIVLALPSIATWLMQASGYAASKMIDDELSTFKTNGNLLTTFENLLNSSTYGAKIDVNLFEIMFVISCVLIILFTIFGVINSMTASLEGESAESPIKLLLRGVITVILEVIFFGVPSMHSAETWFVTGGAGGLISGLGQLGNKILALIAPVGTKIGVSAIPSAFAIGLPYESIVYIILALSIFTGTIGACIVFIERYLTFGLFVLIGPVAIATNASKTTERTFHDWLTGLLSNFVSLFISLLGFRLFFSCLTNVTTGADLIGPESLTRMAVCIGLMQLMQNSEKIVNALGFKTIANGDTARAVAAGSRLATRAFMMTGGKAIANGLNHIGNRGTQERANFATKTLGSGNAIAKGMNYINSAKNGAVPLNSKYNMSSNKVAATDSGMIQAVKTNFAGQTQAANISSNSRRAQAISTTNNAMYDESGNVNVGKRVDMKDSAVAFGLDGNSGIRFKETGVVTQMPDGKAGIIAQTQIQNDKGIWEDKTMVLSPTSEQFDAGAGLITTQNGAMGYSIKGNGDLYQLGNNSMQMTEIEKSSSLNGDQFEAMPDEIYQNFADNNAYNAQMQESINNIEAQIENGEYYSSLEASGAFFNSDRDEIYHDSTQYNNTDVIETEKENFLERFAQNAKNYESTPSSKSSEVDKEEEAMQEAISNGEERVDD